MNSPITPADFDTITMRSKKRRIIWTLESIAGHIGVSVDFVRNTVAKEPGSPIRKMGTRWYVYQDDLDRFMETGPAQP